MPIHEITKENAVPIDTTHSQINTSSNDDVQIHPNIVKMAFFVLLASNILAKKPLSVRTITILAASGAASSMIQTVLLFPDLRAGYLSRRVRDRTNEQIRKVKSYVLEGLVNFVPFEEFIFRVMLQNLILGKVIQKGLLLKCMKLSPDNPLCGKYTRIAIAALVFGYGHFWDLKTDPKYREKKEFREGNVRWKKSRPSMVQAKRDMFEKYRDKLQTFPVAERRFLSSFQSGVELGLIYENMGFIASVISHMAGNFQAYCFSYNVWGGIG